MISPARLLRLGLSPVDIAVWLGLSVEQVEADLQAAEERRTPPAPAGRTLMTPLLIRPDLDRWETRRAERQALGSVPNWGRTGHGIARYTMTLQEEKFVNAYFQSGGNATRAAEEAGYSDPNANGWHIRNQADVKAEIDRRLDEMAMPANEVLARLADHGRASLGDFLTASGRGVRLDVAKAVKSGKAHLLKSYSKSVKDGVKIEMVDAQAALVQLGRHHKLFTDKTELTGKDGASLLGEMTDADLDKFITASESSASGSSEAGEDREAAEAAPPAT